MASNVRERPYRTRTPMRETPRGDTVSTALTAQTIICVLMIIAVLIIKKTDAAEFSQLREQYRYMLSESSKSEIVDNWILERGNFFTGFADTVKEYINMLTPKKSEEAPSSPQAEDEPEDEIYEFPQTGTDDEPEKPAQAKYNYLTGGEDFEYMTASGGMFPVDGGTAGMRPAPQGSMLSPVYISSKIKPPVTGLITSEFSYRYHPMTGESDFHTGIDVASPEGAAILAALPGVVAETGESEIYGNYIVLQHAENLKTSYSHCSEIIAEEGMTVRQGERIALVGETGVATGPHLHFSVIAGDNFVDPVWMLSEYIKLVE